MQEIGIVDIDGQWKTITMDGTNNIQNEILSNISGSITLKTDISISTVFHAA